MEQVRQVSGRTWSGLWTRSPLQYHTASCSLAGVGGGGTGRWRSKQPAARPWSLSPCLTLQCLGFWDPTSPHNKTWRMKSGFKCFWKNKNEKWVEYFVWEETSLDTSYNKELTASKSSTLRPGSWSSYLEHKSREASALGSPDPWSLGSRGCEIAPLDWVWLLALCPSALVVLLSWCSVSQRENSPPHRLLENSKRSCV